MVIASDAAKSVTILGSTGSIGCNTVKLLLESEEAFCVEAITANSNAVLLAKQAKQLNAKVAVVANERFYPSLKEALAGSDIEAACGNQAVIEAAKRPSDVVMSAIVGAAGLAPTMVAIERGATIALANKECLVCAGDVMTNAVAQHHATLIPVDSEHNAIFQLFDFDTPKQVDKVILTASGGPFRTFSQEQMAQVTSKQAVAHPNWSMGAKISVDSATMMNKGLELIEAYHLFPIEKQQLDVLVHPESVIHSMVEYMDGSVLAQLGTPDMRTPISFALNWPKRMHTSHERLSLATIGTLHFEHADEARFPALTLARKALDYGGSAPVTLNMANEVAVQSFLEGNIGFLDIAAIVETMLENASSAPLTSLEEVLAVMEEVKAKTHQCIEAINY